MVLEAVACGLPVITSSYNGAAELLKPPQDGYVIEDPHDNRRLAGCLLELLDPVRRMACAGGPSPRRRLDVRSTFPSAHGSIPRSGPSQAGGIASPLGWVHAIRTMVAECSPHASRQEDRHAERDDYTDCVLPALSGILRAGKLSMGNHSMRTFILLAAAGIATLVGSGALCGQEKKAADPGPKRQQEITVDKATIGGKTLENWVADITNKDKNKDPAVRETAIQTVVMFFNRRAERHGQEAREKEGGKGHHQRAKR